MSKQRVITVDGPSGTGKGTISSRLAKQLGWHLLDSGALYRITAWAVKEYAWPLEDLILLKKHIQSLDIAFKENAKGDYAVYCNDTDVSCAIRLEDCGMLASKLAAIAVVRDALFERQKAFLTPPGLIADGRDMGSVVFPNAILKIYLNASNEVRAERRFKQLQSSGIDASVRQIQKALLERDVRDKTRKTAPLKPALDAHIIDTSDLSIDEVFEHVMHFVRQVHIVD